MAKVSIFTPSFNKKRWVLEGIKSIIDQSFKDFDYLLVDNSTDLATRLSVKEMCATDKRLAYLERDFTAEERKKNFIGSILVNEYLPTLTGDYILYKSDDDLLDPSCLETCVAYLDAHPDAYVVWFSMKDTEEQEDGTFLYLGGIKANKRVGLNTRYPEVVYKLDGGQIIYRRECLEKVIQPFYPSGWLRASRADGLFMNQLAKFYTFYPITKDLLEHRRTQLSSFTGVGVKLRVG